MNLHLYLKDCKSTFDFETAVCNHGCFMMSPNVWNASTKSLSRPLRLKNSSSVNVTIFHPPDSDFLVVQVHGINNLAPVDEEVILQQVTRMLRISVEDEKSVREFHETHKVAKERGFGRIFRSPSLFEDIVKTMLLCHSSWQRTLDMVARLCKLQPTLARGSSQSKGSETIENFPNAEELASLEKKFLGDQCKLGFRTEWIIRYAKRVMSKNLNLEKLDKVSDTVWYEKTCKSLSSIAGIGTFACANVLMCIGYYENIAADTETLRHLQEVHGMRETTQKTLEKDVKELYQKYAPFQSLAYWLEKVEDYERKCGKLSELNPSEYHPVSGSFLAKRLKENE